MELYMLLIDKAIFDTDRAISKNIAAIDTFDRGFLSQNILSQLRNFVEYIAQKVYSNGLDIDPNNYDMKNKALEFIKSKGEFRFISKFHNLLQKSVSHYTFDEGGSERLMLKYYEYLVRIKTFLKSNYNIDVLYNIDSFPLNLDSNLSEYYEKIGERIDFPSSNAYRDPYNDRAYIEKIKPFFVGHKIYYEVIFTIAVDYVSKFDRIIAFTRFDISDNYAVKLSMHNDIINVIGKSMPIKIIDSWQVSMRPCELKNFAKILGREDVEIRPNQYEYRELMNFLTFSNLNLTDIATSSDNSYLNVKQRCTYKAKTTPIFGCLDLVRDILRNNTSGENVIRYLLYKLNNNVIKKQYSFEKCSILSNLKLSWDCAPFDSMPFATSLVNHNPRLYDLLECIDNRDREHEFLARKIHVNAEQNGMLFTPIKDLLCFGNIKFLAEEYNKRLYYKHTNRKLKIYKDHVYENGFAEDTAEIIEKIIDMAQNGVDDYKTNVESWLNNSKYNIDCPEKLQTLKTMFESSCVALIYGAAGTGKSTLINHISNLYNNEKKLYLANTNPAVDNMRRKVNSDSHNCTFMTIKKYNSNYTRIIYDLVIIDECSTVSNSDMKYFLEHTSFNKLVLVGDVFQIESIRLGNWFSVANRFVPKTAITELIKPYRTTNDNLLTVWERVRTLDDAILEPMVKAGLTTKLDDSIFEYRDKDEIVLCLNYDGLYGINNLNRLLQSNNPNRGYIWGINTYKVNDPILFNESTRFNPYVYNNMKGRIVDIELSNSNIRFDIELDHFLDRVSPFFNEFALIGLSSDNNSIIRFYVDKFESTDEDDESNRAIVPFQIAYAVSIHKAQGLEYNSVKIVITNEVEELITHNIFYTAITRAREKLKIYWSPETEKKILESLSARNYNKDAALIASLYKLKMSYN